MKSIWTIVYGALDASKSARASFGRALEQAASLAGSERLVFVGLEQDRPWWAPLLAKFPGAVLIEQPLDRGTGTGIIAAVTQVLRRDPQARLLLIDGSDAAGLELVWPHILEVLVDGPASDERIILFGSSPASEGPARSMTRLGGLAFEGEVPARELGLDRGAMRAMSPIVTSVPALIGAAQATHPRALQAFLSRLDEGGELGVVLDEIYPFCAEIDLFRDLIAGVPHQAWVRRVGLPSEGPDRPILMPGDATTHRNPQGPALAV